MVTLETKAGCTLTEKGEFQMGLIIGAGCAMTMLVVSLAFQRASLKKVKVTVEK